MRGYLRITAARTINVSLHQRWMDGWMIQGFAEAVHCARQTRIRMYGMTDGAGNEKTNETERNTDNDKVQKYVYTTPGTGITGIDRVIR